MREVRKVPADWQHPRDTDSGRFLPLFSGYKEEIQHFLEIESSDGLKAAIDYFGRKPNKDDYMPEWREDQKTHYMMYEITSEGTPISPAFADKDELARWLVQNEVPLFARQKTDYQGWMNVIDGKAANAFVARMPNGNDSRTI